VEVRTVLNGNRWSGIALFSDLLSVVQPLSNYFLQLNQVFSSFFSAQVHIMAAPKLDIKMLIVPAVLYFGKKIDFKDPAVMEMTRNGFIAGMKSVNL
jgi:hypothetical protein